MDRAITLDICRSCMGVGSIIGATGQCETCFKQDLYRTAFKPFKHLTARSLARRQRTTGHLLFGALSLAAMYALQDALILMGAQDHLVKIGMLGLLGLALFLWVFCEGATVAARLVMGRKWS